MKQITPADLRVKEEPTPESRRSRDGFSTFSWESLGETSSASSPSLRSWEELELLPSSSSGVWDKDGSSLAEIPSKLWFSWRRSSADNDQWNLGYAKYKIIFKLVSLVHIKKP